MGRDEHEHEREIMKKVTEGKRRDEKRREKE